MRERGGNKLPTKEGKEKKSERTRKSRGGGREKVKNVKVKKMEETKW